MSLSSMMLVGAPLAPLQVAKGKQPKQGVLEIVRVSRRDALLNMTAATLVLCPFVTTESAEARTGRLERKKKIMEKLRKQREGKQKTENEGRNRDKEVATITPPVPFPNPGEGAIGPIIEAIVP